MEGNYTAEHIAMVMAMLASAQTLAARYQCVYAIISDHNGMDHYDYCYLMAYSTVRRESVECLVYPDGTYSTSWEN